MYERQLINAKKQERKRLFDKGTEILNRAKDGVLAAEDQNEYDAVMADFDKIGGEVERMERHNEAESLVTETRGGEGHKPDPEENQEKRGKGDDKEFRNAFERYLRFGKDAMTREELNALQTRAMSSSTGSAGGYLVPDEFADKIIEKLANVSVMRKLATIIQTRGDYKIPIANGKGTVVWTGENAAFTESDPDFAQKTLDAYKLTYLVRVPEELAHDETFDLFGYLARCYADLAGEAQESKFFQGSGTSEISGAIAGASDGVTAAAPSAITMDELLSLKYALKPQYWAGAAWIFSPATTGAIRKLKDSSGRYLWQPSLQVGQPDNFDGKPVYVTAGMPDMAASKVPVLFGDFSYYWITERGGRVFQTLKERYADLGQIGFRAYERVDGALTLSETVKKLTMAAE